MHLNRVIVLGNLTKDPELRATTTGQSVCTFGLATNQFYTNREGQKQLGTGSQQAQTTQGLLDKLSP